MIISINRATGAVKDINQFYDERYFDNVTYADGTIPEGENPRFYKRLANSTTIVKMSEGEIEAISEAELRKRLRAEVAALVQQIVADVAALPAGPQKTLLTEILQLIRKLTLISRLE